jgi:hypothetical protein
MGAWGGWALAPNTASMGRDCRSHIYSVAEGPPHVQTGSDFFLLFGKDFQSVFRTFPSIGWRQEIASNQESRAPFLIET